MIECEKFSKLGFEFPKYLQLNTKNNTQKSRIARRTKEIYWDDIFVMLDSGIPMSKQIKADANDR